jgi:hypothetical protein
MKDRTAVVRLFKASAGIWLIGFLFVLWQEGDAPWFAYAPYRMGSTFSMQNALYSLAFALPPRAMHWACVALGLLSTLLVLDRLPRVGSVLLWLGYTLVLLRCWLAVSGGAQLMALLLFWSCFFVNDRPAMLAYAGFWAARLQVLLVYALAAAHKLCGPLWRSGEAIHQLALNPDYSLAFLGPYPGSCKALTWGVLVFLVLFPLAVWWKPTRRAWLCMGAVFHLATAVWLGLPEMALAFLACYSLWLSSAEAENVLQFLRAMKKRSMQSFATGRTS